MNIRADTPGAVSHHRMRFGSELRDDGVFFRIFAPGSRSVRIEINGRRELLPMHALADGWHEVTIREASAGTRYRFVLPDDTPVPDPASRFQPRDVYGSSEVIDPLSYRWADASWHGLLWEQMILYELHVGTFTKEGTFRSAIEKLDHLTRLGVTGIELMAIADFPGTRNWGYDGVLLYAPDSVYGRPEDLKAFMDAAHARGIAIIVDVVYNHLGGEGNMLPRYFPRFYSPVHDNPWGRAPNFDADGCEEVREFIIHNALYWIEEFHADGLRLDASHAMVDNSPRHLLDELAERVHRIAGERIVHLILEDEHNASRRLVRDRDGRLTAYSAQWNHQMAHLRELPGEGHCALHSAFDRKTQIVARMMALGYGGTAEAAGEEDVIDCKVPPTAYISFLQTHDLVGNDLIGQRIYSKVPLDAVRALSALYLLVPQIPMLFMGDEWGASTPFPFFCDFRAEIAGDVRKGRLLFLQKELRLDVSMLEKVPDPLALATFHSAHLDWSESEGGVHREWLEWYRRILRVRHKEIVPLLRGIIDQCGTYCVLGPGAFLATWRLAGGVQIKLEANLCSQPTAGFPEILGRVLWQEGSTMNSQKLGPWTVRWLKCSSSRQGDSESSI